MKKLIVVLTLALSLGACASFQADIAKLQQAYTLATTATVSPGTAQIAANSFDVLVAGATEYLKYCKITPADARCSAGTLDKPGPLRLVIHYVRTGRTARNQIEAAGRSGALISSTAYNTIIEAVNGLTSSPAASFGASK